PLRTPAAGLLEVRLFSEDDFAGDNRAVLEVPAREALLVTIYTRRSELLRPLVSSSPFVEPVYRLPEEYTGEPDDGIVVLDGFHPGNAPPGNVVWIEPPADDSPAPVRTIARDVSVESWHPEHPLALGLDTRDLRLGQTLVFETEGDWEAVATAEDGAVVLVSENDSGKAVLLGFHPGAMDLRFELASPLLFANVLRWFEPELFGQWELRAGSVGSSEIALGAGVTADQVEVTTQDGAVLPATVSDGTLRFFAGSPGVVNVQAGDRQVVFSVALPEIPSTVWEPPQGVRSGVPEAMEATAASRELWRWLVLAAVLILLIEWLYYGRRRTIASSKQRPLPLAGWLRSRSE
ncbi:MAG: hypothetical protein GY953_25620, partial [bacterium]|nr:hypothetical protein [bacterium]